MAGQEGFFDTSASQIANYRGDPANALGGDAALSNVLGDTDATGINDALTVVASARMQKNKAIYDAQIKAQAELFEKLNAEDVQLKQMLPDDREFLWKNFRDPVRALVMDPEVLTDRKKSVKLQQAMSDFKEAKAYTAVRTTAITKLDADIAAEKEPERRNRMLEHRNKMYGQSIYDEVKPFQEVLDFSKKTFVNPGVKEDVLSSTPEGDMEVKTTHRYSPWEEYSKQTQYNYLHNPDQKIASEMRAFAQSVHELPTDEAKKWIVEAWNKKIEKGNADNKLTDSDTYYVPPIVGHVVKDEDGVERYKINATVPEMVRAQSILDNYINEEHKEKTLSTLPGKLRLQDAQTQKAKMDAWLTKEKGKLIPAQVANFRAQATEHTAKAHQAYATAKKLKSETIDVNWNVDQVRQVYDPKKYASNPDAKDFGIPGIVSGKVIMAHDPNKKIFLDQKSALSDVEVAVFSVKLPKADGKSSELIKPETLLYNTDNPKDPYFIGYYPIPHRSIKKAKDGKTDIVETYITYESKITRPHAFLQTLVENTSGPAQAGIELNKTIKHWKEKFKTDNINGSIFSTFDDADWKEKNDDLENFMNEKPPAKAGTKKLKK